MRANLLAWLLGNRCPRRRAFGLNEYDWHSHRCTKRRNHPGDHDFTSCPEGRS